MVTRIGFDEPGELPRSLPIESAAVDDNSPDTRAVATKELRRRVDHDVGPVLDRPQEIGGGERVVHHKRDALLMCDLGDALDIAQVRVRIADALDEHGFRILPDSRSQCIEIIYIEERAADAILSEGPAEQIVGTSVDRAGGHDVVPGVREILHGDGDRGLAARCRQRPYSTL